MLLRVVWPEEADWICKVMCYSESMVLPLELCEAVSAWQRFCDVHGEVGRGECGLSRLIEEVVIKNINNKELMPGREVYRSVFF